MIAASAPGKIVLCGEYAVLAGAPAIGVALDRRARITLQATDRACNSVMSPGFGDRRYDYLVEEPGGFKWRDEERPDYSLFESIWRANALTSNLFDVMLDTSAFTDEKLCKFGLGSSAALTVALSAALAKARGQPVDLDGLIEHHRKFQGGRGSGIDIAVALHGGVLQFRAGRTADVTAVEWCNGLEYAVLWSGAAASTAQQLERFSAVTKSSVDDSLAAASESISRSWSSSGAEDLLELFKSYVRALLAFDKSHGLGIFDAGHAALAQMAGRHDVVYKPCGAGGGDVGIVLAVDAERMNRFIDAASQHGFQQLNATIDPTGLTVGQ